MSMIVVVMHKSFNTAHRHDNATASRMIMLVFAMLVMEAAKVAMVNAWIVASATWIRLFCSDTKANAQSKRKH